MRGRASPSSRLLLTRNGQWHPDTICARCARRLLTTDGRFQEGDNVLLKRSIKTSNDPDGTLLWPLKAHKVVNKQNIRISHNDIIGKRVRDVVSSSSGVNFRIHDPTLEEYVALTPRECTPIYAQDANIIVSLLDIHPPTPLTDHKDDPTFSPFAVLESGTGHGSLTLHLARALHGLYVPRSDAFGDLHHESRPERRNAVVHTVENNATRFKHAHKIVHGFRRGLYAGNVEFHRGEIGPFLEKAAGDEGGVKQSFDHIILDLPSSCAHLGSAAKVLKVDGCLLLWVPSVTQILDSMRVIRSESLPLHLEKTVEVGQDMSGGRIWDIRLARVREYDRKVASEAQTRSTAAESGLDSDSSDEAEDSSESDRSKLLDSAKVKQAGDNGLETGEVFVCRPKVGMRIVGGGFVALLRRIREEGD